MSHISFLSADKLADDLVTFVLGRLGQCLGDPGTERGRVSGQLARNGEVAVHRAVRVTTETAC